MKKKLKISLILTLIINCIGFLVNLISAYKLERLPLAIKTSGGEITTKQGFGVILKKYYELSLNPKNVVEIKIDLFSLVLSLIIVFIVSLIIMAMINKKKS